MQVQKVQSANNNYKTHFKASFVNDSHGYLKRVWENARKDDILELQIKKFAANQPEHKLEITDLSKFDTYFEVFNHHTGKSIRFATDSHSNLLRRFFEDIFNNGNSNYLFYE